MCCLPGYTLSSYTASGWSCSGTSTVTCTSSQVVAGGSSFVKIQLFVNVPAASPASVSNTALAWGGGDLTHTNSGNAASGTDSNVSVVQVPSSVTITAGGTQSATINTAFGTALTVVVKDAAGVSDPDLQSGDLYSPGEWRQRHVLKCFEYDQQRDHQRFRRGERNVHGERHGGRTIQCHGGGGFGQRESRVHADRQPLPRSR